MLFGDTAARAASLSDTQHIAKETGSLLTRKIWLPKVIYRALPAFYFIAGASALLATVYISDWFWVLPHYLLFSGACLHMAVLVHHRRRRRKS